MFVSTLSSAEKWFFPSMHGFASDYYKLVFEFMFLVCLFIILQRFSLCHEIAASLSPQFSAAKKGQLN